AATSQYQLTPVALEETEGEIHLRTVQQIDIRTDTREILANATKDIERYRLNDYFIVDVDSHHVELDSWAEILEYVENPVLRRTGREMARNWPFAKHLALSNHPPGMTFQDVAGRIPHMAQLGEFVEPVIGEHRDVTLVRRAMESMGIDIQVVFPQPMLEVGLHPSPDIEAQLILAYNRWFSERILTADLRVKSMLALPFGNPEACLRMIREFAGKPGVVGFLVTSQRNANLWEPEYLPVYRELEERGLPLGFHAGPDYAMGKLMNRFISVHSISFVTCNMVHMTNWIMNGLSEKFPRLKVLWIESGLAWLPFMMQRLDHEFLMRQSEAPSLKRLPSEYMREMFYTSQPMERTNLKLLEATFEAINAETQLLYASDWPHWDFDTPGVIAGLPFLSEQARRNILGENARRVFNL
ncbi:MAG TPA: amidohydrolase family protein, partial [Bryobacteraceae bacterium]|nr:amidohydrolase family protein [Bryobacteraceae bacterium]